MSVEALRQVLAREHPSVALVRYALANAARDEETVEPHLIAEAEALLSVLATRNLRQAMERHHAWMIMDAIRDAEGANVEEAIISEASDLVAELRTGILRDAMAQRDLRQLRQAIRTAEREISVVSESVIAEAKLLIPTIATEELRREIDTRDVRRIRSAVRTAEQEEVVDESVIEEAKAAWKIVATEHLKQFMDDISKDIATASTVNLAMLRKDIAAAERENMVDESVVEEAKALAAIIATNELRHAMEVGAVQKLRNAIASAEKETTADKAVIEEAKALVLVVLTAALGEAIKTRNTQELRNLIAESAKVAVERKGELQPSLSEVEEEARALLPVLQTEELRRAMAKHAVDGASRAWGSNEGLPYAIGVAQRDGTVDPAVIDEAVRLIAKQELRRAMNQRNLKQLRDAMAAVEAEEGVDEALIEEAEALVPVLMTEELREFMDKRVGWELRTAVASAEREEGVDKAVIAEAKELATVVENETDTELTLEFWSKWNGSFYSTAMTRAQSEYWLAGDRRNHLFIVQNGYRPWLEGDGFDDDEDFDEDYEMESYTKEGEPTAKEVYEFGEENPRFFEYNNEDGTDTYGGDIDGVYIKVGGDDEVRLRDFIEKHGCQINVAEEYVGPNEETRFNAKFLAENRGLAMFSGGHAEKRNSFDVQILAKAGSRLELSRLQFTVHRVWSSIYHYTDYLQSDVEYDNDGSGGSGDDDNDDDDDDDDKDSGVTISDYNDWESQTLEECSGDIEPMEEHVTYHFVAGACINRWAKSALARRRLELLQTWRVVLLGSRRVVALRDATNSAAAAAAAVEQNKESHLWKMGKRGTGLVGEFLGISVGYMAGWESNGAL